MKRSRRVCPRTGARGLLGEPVANAADVLLEQTPELRKTRRSVPSFRRPQTAALPAFYFTFSAASRAFDFEANDSPDAQPSGVRRNQPPPVVPPELTEVSDRCRLQRTRTAEQPDRAVWPALLRWGNAPYRRPTSPYRPSPSVQGVETAPQRVATGHGAVTRRPKEALMAAGFVHTVNKAGTWMNRIEGQDEPLPAVHPTKQIAVAAGREEAIRRRTEHVVHNEDGSIGERNSYGNDAVHRPG
jgi:Uncharacterized protein conserved in bacteria (DUF2188)